MLQDIDGVLNRLSPKSIFLVTIDARAKLPRRDYDLDDLRQRQRDKKIIEVYSDWFGAYIDEKITTSSLDPNAVPGLFYRIATGRIRQTLDSRRRVEFLQIFNFLYADGAPMLTIGGILGAPDDSRRLRENGLIDLKYVRTGHESLRIDLPYLTIREKQWIDSALGAALTYDRLCFELEEELLKGYRVFYKEYPTFTESLS